MSVILESEKTRSIAPASAVEPPAATTWDARVDAWADVCAGPAFLRFRDRVIAEAGDVTDADVVDIGCGTGLLAFALAPTSRRVWAVDYSIAMLRDIRRRAEESGLTNVAPIHADARSLPLADASTDIAVSSYALHHLDDAGKRQSIAEAYRVLRPGCRLIVVDMMFEFTLGRDDRRILATKALQLLRKGPAGAVRLLRNAYRVATGTWEHPAGTSWWEQAARDAGFADVRVERLEQEAGILIAVKPAA